MRHLRNNQQGSGHLVLLIGVLVIAVVAFAAYRVSQSTDTTAPGSAPTAVSNTVPATLKTTADLQKASNALDNTSIDGSVNPNQLDNDLNGLL